MRALPQISVVVPAYQAEAFLEKTLASVLNQSVLPSELIVVDDGSRDGTCAVVTAFSHRNPELPLRLLREGHRGPGATRNSGIQAAHSEWIAFLDADDLWHPDKVKRVVEAITENPGANFFFHHETIRFRDGSESVLDYGSRLCCDRSLPQQLFLSNYFSTSSIVCRRDLLLHWGGFDASFPSSQDYELWLRMSPDLRPKLIPEILGAYTWRQGNISTSNYWRRLRDVLRVKHRHRAKGGWRLYVYAMARATAGHLARGFRGRTPGRTPA